MISSRNEGSRLTRAIAVAALALVALAVAACATFPPLTLSRRPRAFTALDYQRVYESWTRRTDQFDVGRLESQLAVTATFEGWEFRWAYVVRYASDFALTTEMRTEMLRTSLADADQHHRFFITLLGRTWRESDLAAPTSAWRIVLVDSSGRETIPGEIESLERPNAATQRYFRSVSPLRRAFRISFPTVRADGSPSIADGASHVILRFTGALGRVDLKWDLVPEAPPAA